METSSGSAPPVAAWQADRKGGWIPGRERMPRKRTPAAERQRESGTAWPVTPPAVSYNRPDTGPGARARKRADVGRGAFEARQRKPLEPKGKLGAMTGYSWSTPAVVMGAATVNGPEGQARDHDLAGWDAIDWRACEGEVRRRRGRGF